MSDTQNIWCKGILNIVFPKNNQDYQDKRPFAFLKKGVLKAKINVWPSLRGRLKQTEQHFQWIETATKYMSPPEDETFTLVFTEVEAFT